MAVFSIERSKMGQDRANLQGFWGPATSNVDWCEENYVGSFYIAEYYNTITNLNYILLALFGIYSAYRTKSEMRVYLVYIFGLAAIGIGSWLFHMTLLFPLQLADELPMIYGTAILIHSILNVNPPNSFSFFWAVVLLAYSASVHALYVYTGVPLYFHVGYGIIAVVSGLGPFYHAFQLKSRKPAEARNLLKTLIFCQSCYVLGFIFWVVENNYCLEIRDWRNKVGFPWNLFGHFHALWHLLTGIGAYGVVVCTQFLRLLAIGRTDVELRYFVVYPFVAMIDKHKQE